MITSIKRHRNNRILDIKNLNKKGKKHYWG